MKLTFKKNLTYLFLVSLLFLLTCQKNPTGPQGIKDFYPLSVGNFWFYVNSQYSYKILDEIIGYDHLSDGSLVFVKRRIKSSGDFFQNNFQLEKNADTAISYLQFTGDELREYPNKNCNLEYKIVLKFPLEVGTEWHVLAESSCVYGKLGRPLYIDNGWVITIENIKTPAGIFNNCFEIWKTPAYTDYGEMHWFYPYLGIVQFEIVGWGWRINYVLQEYRVR